MDQKEKLGKRRVTTKEVLVLCDDNSKANEATKNSLWVTNSITWVCVYLSTVTLCSQRDKSASEMLSCFVGREQEEGENKVLSPRREHWRGLPLVPPGMCSTLLRPLLGGLSVPKDSIESSLPGITRASGRKLHGIIKGVFVSSHFVWTCLYFLAQRDFREESWAISSNVQLQCGSQLFFFTIYYP